MVVIRAIKIEDSIMIKLPSTLGVKEGEEFFFIKKDNGSITLIPKVEDHFADVHDEEYYMPEEDVGFSPSQGELDGL